MNKYKIILIFAFSFLLTLAAGAFVFAQNILPPLTTACESKDGTLRGFADNFSRLNSCPKDSRAVTLGQSLSKTSFYVKTFAPFTAAAGSTNSIVFGCDDGDVAVGGGAEKLSGNIKNWRTVFSHPVPDPDSQPGVNAGVWETTVINLDTTPQSFAVRARCLDVSN